MNKLSLLVFFRENRVDKWGPLWFDRKKRVFARSVSRPSVVMLQHILGTMLLCVGIFRLFYGGGDGAQWVNLNIFLMMVDSLVSSDFSREHLKVWPFGPLIIEYYPPFFPKFSHFQYIEFQNLQIVSLSESKYVIDILGYYLKKYVS